MRSVLLDFFKHFFVTVFFAVVALAYFYPVLQGKTIFQSDIVQYRGMAQEQEDFRKKNETEPYWTNSAFGGMPTYQLGARYPYHYVKKLDQLIRFLPRPADYLFLYFIGFYIALLCMKVDYRLAVLGALAYGFSTYFIIILGVGHNAKAHALGYLPFLLGGIILMFRKKYFWGLALTALAMALEIQANHYQMTYYFMLLVILLGLAYLVDAIRKKQLSHYFLSVGLLVVAVVIGIAANATALMATREYADWSTRGTSRLTLDVNGNPKSSSDGLNREYITMWSYGITESLNLWAPRLFGGASVEKLGASSKTYDFLVDQGIPRSQALEFTQSLPLYWGEQPGTSGPAYVGAIILFFFLLGILLVKGKAKWWLLAGSIMSLLLSWGHNFSLLTDFMIDNFPLYNKFRAVSSIQVILELCVPLLAVLGLSRVFDPSVSKEHKIRALKISGITFLALGVGLLLLRSTFDFIGSQDEIYERYYGEEIVSLIQRDREAVYMNDILRSLIYTALAALTLWLFIKGRVKTSLAIPILIILIGFDLIGVDLRYVNKDNFVPQRRMLQPFTPSEADRTILQDDSIFRVFNSAEGLEGGRTSYFHKSLGGYHAAKPAGISDLFEYQVYQGNQEVLNMLNTKYIIQQNESGELQAVRNPEALGNAWFVKKLVPVTNPDEEITELDDIDLSSEALINTTEFPDLNRMEFQVDSTAILSLVSYAPNHLIYESANAHAGIAVFSEMYYAQGWNAYIDGAPKPHFRVNYALRALRVPEGSHKIEFKFEPEVVKTGSKITLGGSIGLLLSILVALGYTIFQSRRSKPD